MTPRAPVPHVTRPRAARSRVGRLLEQAAAAVLLPLTFFAALATLVATRLAAVGVQVRTDALAGDGDELRAISSQYFVAGLTDRGRTGIPVAVNSMTEFKREFGKRVSYGFLTDDLSQYFAEGGTRAQVLRKVGPAATKGTLTLVDRAGAPLNTIRIDAISAGAWSTNVQIKVDNGTVTNSVNLSVIVDGETVRVYRNHLTPASLVAAINADSKVITATDLGSATAAPNNRPAVLAATALSAGNDDRAAVTPTLLVNELALFTADLGPGAVAIPGYGTDDVGAGVKAHALATGRDGFLHGASTDALAAAITDAAALQVGAGSEYVGMLHPWVKIPDPDLPGASLTVPPTGFAAGVRARAHQAEGPWRIPAGDDYPARYITGVSKELTTSEVDQANEGFVIPIVPRAQARRNVLYGYRSTSSDEANFYHLSSRSTLNALAWDCGQALAPYVFRPIDSRGALVTAVRSVLEGVCERYRAAGGLFEKRDANNVLIDRGFAVSVTANPALRVVEAVVSVRIAEGAELIIVTVLKVPATAAV